MYVILVSAAHAWGLRGHRIVARIAENHLNETAQSQVKELLGSDTLTKVANEADSYRSDSKWKCAAPLHYVSIEDNEQYLTAEKHAQGDIVRALFYFEDILRDEKSTKPMKAIALKWLVHLVGDIHQPLHVGRSCDRGGNSTKVRWFGSDSNLHKVWDSQLINHEELSYTEFADFLDKADQPRIEPSNYIAWSNEARQLRQQLYTCLAKDNCCERNAKRACKAPATEFGSCSAEAPELTVNVEYAYVEKNRELLNRQLLKAGLRLADLLNRIFAATPLSDQEKSARVAIEKIRRDAGDPVKDCVMQAVK